MATRTASYDRDPFDWYVEPAWAVELLFNTLQIPFGRLIHDPCAGVGTIPETARSRGYVATGSDLVNRAGGRYPVVDFLADKTKRDVIVCNPPFKTAAAMIQHAMTVAEESWFILPLTFLSSQSRYPLFTSGKLIGVHILSRRPSMPPGKMLQQEGEVCRRGGSVDYAWVGWTRGGCDVSTVGFLR